jgi:transcriptional regulator with XRE-family HTH domain
MLAASAAWSAGAALVQVPPPVKSDQIALHEIDVDQGVAALLETPCGAIMIDAGGRTAGDTAHLMAYLKAFFDARPALNYHLAAIFLTHTHIDHDLSMNEVAATYRPAGFIYNGHLSPKLSGGPQANDMIALTKTSPVIPTVAVNQDTFKTTKKAGYTDAVISLLSCSGVSPRWSRGIGLAQPEGTHPVSDRRQTMTQTLTRTGPDTLDVAIGAAIRLRRKQLRISQEMLAERCGVTFQQVQKYENGANRVSFSRLVQIAHALGLRVSDLVGDIDQAAGFSPTETALLTNLGVSGATELIEDFARLSPQLRHRVRDLVRDMANSCGG